MRIALRRCAVLVVGLLFVGAQPVERKTLTVLAAISLRDVLSEVTTGFESGHAAKIDLVFGGSGQLAMQVRQGAPADVFISAADKQVDELIAAKLAEASTRLVVATNTLVVVAPPDGVVKSVADLKNAKRIAIGEPRSVPAGQYATQALASLKLDVTGKLVYGSNVKQVADYVARGEVDAGFVYATDAVVAKLNVVALVPAESHDPIRYPAIVLSEAREPDVAKAFLEYLQSDGGRMTLAKHGFVEATTQPTR